MNTSTNKDKGRTGLAIAIGYYGSKGYSVSIPLNDTQDYDIIVDNGTLKRVQVKCTGCLDNYGRYSVSLRSCGGTNGSVYKRVIDTDIDILFVVCTNGWLFEIPKSVITQKNTISLYNEPSEMNDSYKYLVQFTVGDAEVTMLRAKKPKIEKSKVNEKTVKHCVDCGREINKRSTRCFECNNRYLRDKTAWTEETRNGRPSKEELIKLLKDETPFTKIGRMYGVTDNSVRKWCKKYSLPYNANTLLEWNKYEV